MFSMWEADWSRGCVVYSCVYRPLPQPTPGNQQEPSGLEEPSSAPTPHSLPLSSAISSSSLQPQSALRPHSIAGLLNSEKPISPPPLTSPPPPPSINTRSLPRPRRHKKMGGKPQEEDIYSDPIDIAMGNKQKKATLQRRQERDHTLPRTAGTPITGPNQTVLMHLRKQSLTNDDDSYADPKDIIKFGNSESFLPSPSTSPPPPPATPPAVNGNPLVGRGEELYDAVRPPSSKNTWQPPSSGTGCGYDHLSRQVSWKYDHLAGDEAAVNSNPSGRGERPPAPLPDDLHNEAPPVLYAVVGTKTKQNPPTAPQKSNLSQEAPLPDNLYAIVNKPPKSRVPPPARDPEPPPTASGELYATVDTSKKKKMSLTTLTVAGGNGTLPVETARRQPIPSPSSVAHGNHPTAGDSDQLYATVDTSKKRKRTPPPVMPKSPRSPVPPTLNGGPPEFSRGALDRQRKPTKPLVGNGTQFRRKSHDSVLSPAGGVAGRGSTEQLHSQQTENAVQSLYATPMRKAKKPVPPATAPKPGFLHPRSPSPASGSAATSKSLPRGKSFDNDDRVARTDLPHNRTGSPLLGRKVLPTSPGLQLIWADKPYMLDQRMRTTSDPHFSNVGRGRERTHRRGRVGATYTKRAESSEDVWRGGDSVMGGGRHYMYTKRAESSEDVWRGDHEIGGDGEEEDVDEADAEPVLPERKYSASEMGLEDEPPPLPPRNYNWSDVEDDDEDLFQSEDELEETSTRITLEDQQAMYSSLRLYQTRTNSMSGIEELYAIVNQVAKEQEATQQPSSLSQPVANEVANVYDTLESALKQKEHLKMKSAVVASMSQSAERNAPHMQSALGAIGGAGAAVFTPKQLKLIKQQQKLLDKLQKKTEREAIRRRKSEVRRKRREEEEQRKRDGRRKGKKRGPVKEPERQRYFGSPLEAVVEPDGVPRFIKQCTQIIEAKGLKIEGMYRVSGKKDACLSLQDQYDMDSQLDVASMGLCETAISSTLKAFFKLLPEPLISNAVAAKVLDINAGELSEQKKKLELILQQMPAPNLSTLRYLMHHLHTVHQHQEINKMSSSNLAIVFWPTLMRPPLSDLADPSKQLGWQLMMARLIEHPDIVPEVC